MFLSFDGADGDFAAFVHIEAVGLARVHLGVGGAVAVECALADLRVDASGNEEGHADVTRRAWRRNRLSVAGSRKALIGKWLH